MGKYIADNEALTEALYGISPQFRRMVDDAQDALDEAEEAGSTKVAEAIDYSKMVKAELQTLAQSRGLGVLGAKADLVSSLEAYDTANANL